jgi:ribonuclease BN (tRNA processing enzyme)
VAAAAQVSTENLPSTGTTLFHGAEIAWMPVAHPGGCTAFWFQLGGFKIIFTGDLELRQTDLGALHSFAQNADLLICDAQYTEQEYLRYTGWGHSTNLDAAALALASGAKRLLLTHHDPRRSDDEIDSMVAEARQVFAYTEAARDGLIVSGSF